MYLNDPFFNGHPKESNQHEEKDKLDAYDGPLQPYLLRNPQRCFFDHHVFSIYLNCISSFCQQRICPSCIEVLPDLALVFGSEADNKVRCGCSSCLLRHLNACFDDIVDTFLILNFISDASAQDQNRKRL